MQCRWYISAARFTCESLEWQSSNPHLSPWRLAKMWPDDELMAVISVGWFADGSDIRGLICKLSRVAATYLSKSGASHQVSSLQRRIACPKSSHAWGECMMLPNEFGGSISLLVCPHLAYCHLIHWIASMARAVVQSGLSEILFLSAWGSDILLLLLPLSKNGSICNQNVLADTDMLCCINTQLLCWFPMKAGFLLRGYVSISTGWHICINTYVSSNSCWESWITNRSVSDKFYFKDILILRCINPFCRNLHKGHRGTFNFKLSHKTAEKLSIWWSDWLRQALKKENCKFHRTGLIIILKKSHSNLIKGPKLLSCCIHTSGWRRVS